MANQFQIVIAAVDKATGVVRKVNDSFGKLTRPIGQAQAAIVSFGKEAGLDRVAKGMVNVGRAAIDVGEKVAGIVAPMAAVAGVGSIAAVAALATEWGKLGAEIGRTSSTIGVSAGQLQSLRGAARVSGVSAESLTHGLKSLGDTMEDALYGRNQDALVMMNRLGITMKKTEGGAVDTGAAFGDLATVISKIKNPQVQGLVARTFGLEDLLPLLREGKTGIAELQRQVAATGAVMSGPAVAAATSFQKSMVFLDLSFEGLRNSIGEKLIPIIQPLVDQLREWISANRDLIATNVGNFVTGIADAVKQIDWGGVVKGAKEFVAEVKDLVDWMGGWKVAAIAVAVVLNANLLASVINLTLAVGGLAEGVLAVTRVLAGLGVLAAGGVAKGLASGLLKVALFTEGLAGLAAGVPVVGTALSALSGAFLAVGAAIEATPIGWILTGIAAIAGGAFMIYKNWASIVAFFEEKWAAVKAAFDKNWGGGIVKALVEFSPIVLVSQAINAVVEYLTGVNLYDAGAKLISGLVNGIKSALPEIPKSVANAVRAAAGAAKGVVSKVETVVSHDKSVPIGIRQNNPGNLRSWGGMPVVNGYAAFPTPQAGISAMSRQLQLYGGRGVDTIEKIINRWAPSSDHNNVPAYVADVATQTGFGAGTVLNLEDPKIREAIVAAMIKHENGRNPYSADLISKAVNGMGGPSVAVAPSAPAVAAAPSTPVPGAPVATPYSGSLPDALTVPQARADAKAARDAALQSGADGTGASPEVRVRVDFNNAPPGTRVQSDSRGAAAPVTRVSYAMPMGAVV